ncbi:TadE/TadG family type IV pilus assembly protein [Limimaricola pyoseonensis]|uniref:TadE-like protein n=1 Tax=Limimaricola pyoseonensis TaxID=521013 RepID=A0A1G7CQD1_9RHOB|nr:TadE family protein [Limimaricola pyoseonensis]SDE40856.1 TadE-like protein [Limimaricola pyoseonensis]
MTRWHGLRRLARRLARDRRGTASVEFVMIFPVVFSVFLATYELGLTTARQVMLDRAVDIVVRDIRLGLITPVTHDAVKDRLCAGGLLLEDCRAQIRLEMRPVDPRAWVPLPVDVDCVDRMDEAKPVRRFRSGVSNQLMVMRACILFDPIMPTTGIGATMTKGNDGFYASVSTSAFVVEP